MLVGELIKLLADYCPATPVQIGMPSGPEHIGSVEYDDTDCALFLNIVEELP